MSNDPPWAPTDNRTFADMMDDAREALAGNIEVPAPTVICSVCEREILASTAFAIPAIGFMCPRGTKDCKPQRSIWDEIADAKAYDRKVHVDNVAALLIEFGHRVLDVTFHHNNLDLPNMNDLVAEYAEKAHDAATDPTSYIPPRQPRKD